MLGIAETRWPARSTTPAAFPATARLRGAARGARPRGLRLALPAWYLEKQLTDFKSGVRGGHERDLKGQQMITAMQSVDESVFADLISYIQSRQ